MSPEAIALWFMHAIPLCRPVFDYYTAQGKLTLQRVDFSER